MKHKTESWLKPETTAQVLSHLDVTGGHHTQVTAYLKASTKMTRAVKNHVTMSAKTENLTLSAPSI